MSNRIDCFICSKKNISHNEIGLNKKLIGQNVSKFHCMKCLADYLDIPIDDLKDRIEEFKDAGCVLFD